MYERSSGLVLRARLAEKPRQIQIVAGPRQVGKSTLVRGVLRDRDLGSWSYPTADPGENTLEVASRASMVTERETRPPAVSDPRWLEYQWQIANERAHAWRLRGGQLPYVLAIDEIQKIPNWSEVIKGLWDANRRLDSPIHLVLLGSAPLLMQRGLSESLAGRFELIRMSHWSFDEMNEAFGWTLDQYLYFGGYPGSADLISDEVRWRSYVQDSLIRPNIEKDVFEMARVDQRILLQQLFEVGCRYSGQVVALDKVLGTLNSKGNTVTLARYLELLGRAGLLCGLHKYSDHEVRRRRSPPKFNVFNTALMSALGTHSFAEAKADRSYWGRLVESAVGVHLCNATDADLAVHYWREGRLEVDFIVNKGRKLLALEVKSGNASGAKPGLDEFCRRHRGGRGLVVGSEDCPLGEFLRQPISRWLE